ncbi:MAG: HAD-IA family hydrolase [Sphingomonadaceae bacterium]
MAIRYLLFDLDGTLIDTTDLILSCYRNSVSRLVENPPTDAEILKGFGRPLRDQLWRLYPELRHRIDEMFVLWRNVQEELHDSLIKPFPGTVEVLVELKRRGYPMGVVTSKERNTALRGMGLYGLQQLVEPLVCVDDTTNHKPHPEPILRGIELLGARPEETLYVGDSLFDMKAGREAGTKVAAALWGPFPKEPLLEYKPDFALRSIRELLDLCPDLEGPAS